VHRPHADLRPALGAPAARARGGHRWARVPGAGRGGGAAARPAGRHHAPLLPRARPRRAGRGGAAAAGARNRLRRVHGPVGEHGGAVRPPGGGGRRGMAALRAGELRPGGGEPVAALGERPAGGAGADPALLAAGRAVLGVPAGAQDAGPVAGSAGGGGGRVAGRRFPARVALPGVAGHGGVAPARGLRVAGGGRGRPAGGLPHAGGAAPGPARRGRGERGAGARQPGAAEGAAATGVDALGRGRRAGRHRAGLAAAHRDRLGAARKPIEAGAAGQRRGSTGGRAGRGRAERGGEGWPL
ncbi:MAG: SAM-dependent methyltransferase, BioC-like, partial [uncultured Acetobacteraceae bacterium]